MRNPHIGLFCAALLLPVVASAAPSTQFAAAPLGNGGGPRPAVNDNIPPAELGAFVDGVVRTNMEDDHIAGATVSVVRDGAVVFKKGYTALRPIARASRKSRYDPFSNRLEYQNLHMDRDHEGYGKGQDRSR
jgi:CubicO group peptidase (beta-lactamase class C family)